MSTGRIKVLTEVTGASVVKKGDVLGQNGRVEVSSQVPRDSLTQNVEDGGSNEHAYSRDLCERNSV